MNVLSGKLRAATLMETYKQATQRLKQQGITPKLVVITVGEDPASKVYVGQKEKRAIESGMAFEWVKLAEDVTQDTLNATIQRYNDDKDTHGLIVQFPLPKHLSKDDTIRQIASHKDVDGFHAYNMGLVTLNQATLFPCTPKGILDLLESANVSLRGKDVVVIGSSHVVGLPLSIMLINQGATVTVCHIDTKDFTSYTKQADIVIVATGVPHLLKAEHVKEGVIVIDVGINRLPDGKLAGDTDFDAIQPKAQLITPVPGGVGPMTVAMLLEQTLVCACQQNNLDATVLLKGALS